MDEQQPSEEPEPVDGNDSRAGDTEGPVSAVGLAAQLAGLCAGDLGYGDAVRALGSVRQLLAWTEACRARLVERVCATAEEGITGAAGSGPVNQPEPALFRASAIAEVACVLAVSEGVAHKFADDSEQLVQSFTATLGQMEAGRISAAHAAVIVDEAGSIPVIAQPDFERRLLAVAGGLTRAELSGRARRARERAHPESITRRRARAVCDRRVEYQPQRDGMAWLGAYLPAEVVVSGYNRITAAARSLQGPSEARTLTQLRADVFTDLLVNAGVSAGTERVLFTATDGSVAASDGGCPAPNAGQLCGNEHCTACNWPDPAELEPHRGPSASGPYYEGIKAEVLVTVPVFALMGLTEEPAELEGYGPIPADVARKLAAQAPSFKRILTNPETGAMLSFGETSYQVPADLKRAVRVRDPYCAFAGCRSGARHCEMDHVVDWYPVGETCYANIKPECKKHHRLKHHGGWKLSTASRGALTWQSPAGLNYLTEPEGLVLGLPDPKYQPAYLQSLNLPRPSNETPPHGATPEEDPPPF